MRFVNLEKPHNPRDFRTLHVTMSVDTCGFITVNFNYKILLKIEFSKALILPCCRSEKMRRLL